MSEITKSSHDFVGYEYKEISVFSEKLTRYLDAYQNFGWTTDETVPKRDVHGRVNVTLKRDRRILNKAELTRLQRNYEACTKEIQALERAKTTRALITALVVGMIGTALMACSVFAVTAEPPRILACTLFAVPAILCWIAAPVLYMRGVVRKTEELIPLIEAKDEEIYQLCERGHELLPK